MRSAAFGLMLAGSLLTAGAASAQAAFTTLDKTSAARVQFSGAERGKPILAGTTAKVSGEGFRPGQKVTLLYGSTPLPGGSLTAGADGKIDGSIAIPANAVAGTHPIVVVSEGPYSASTVDLKVSPTVPLSGQDGYQVTEAQPARGLYQSAYSAKNNTLFLTSAVGRPPVRQSELVKLDADSLKVLARVTPAAAPAQERRGAPPPVVAAPGNASGADAGPGVYAVYGVAVDDAHGNVWVTNTRQNTVAVYRQSDLSLVKQFAPGAVPHPRDVAVDTATGKVFVSASGEPKIFVFDADSLEPKETIDIASTKRGGAFSAASLSLDAKNGRLYTVSLSTGEVAVINTRSGAVEKVLPVPGVTGAIGVSSDPQTGRIFVAAQGSDNLVVIDADGKLIADTPVGAGALNVVFDPVKRRAYVSNRGASTIAVTDADGKLIANLGPAPMANHVALGRNGTVYAVDKSAGARDADNDMLMKIKPRR